MNDAAFLREAHYVMLTPWDSPLAYIAFGINWLSSLVCIAVSLYFFRQQKGAWWVMIAMAFALPLIESIVRNLWHGLPPLPYGLAGPIKKLPSGGITQETRISVVWDFTYPLVAIGLAWAYLANRTSVKSS